MRWNKIKKILVINVANGFGGAEKSLTDVLEKLTDDYEIKFVAEHEKTIELLNQKGFSYEKLKTGSLKKLNGIFKYITALIRLLFIILDYKPDIILSNTVRSHILSAPISFITRIKSIWILRDYSFSKGVKNFFEFAPKKIICVSKDLKRYYDGNDKYLVISNGLDMSYISDEYSLVYRNEFEIKNDEFIIGLASAFSRWKGIEYLIKAFSEVQQEVGGFKGKLLIAGQAEKGTVRYQYYLELKELVKKLSLEEKVIFIGWIDNIFEFFYNCDVIVSSSISKYGGPESFGRTIIEAWAVKKPVIVTDSGGPRDIVQDEVNGLKVKEMNHKDIEKAIFKLYKNRRICMEIGERGYTVLIKKYNLKNIAQQYKLLFDEI